jgi:integrase
MASIRPRVSKAGERTWQVLYRHGGKQASKTFADPGSAEQFERLVEILGPEKAVAELAAESSGSLTVAELFERWIEWKAGTSVTARTLKDYRRDFDNWIRPRLGHRHADAVDELDVQQWVDWMRTRKLDPKSIGDRHMILGSMYRYGSARTRRLVEHNPCLETQLPTKRKKAAKGFTLPQWQAIYAWAADHEPDAADLLLFIASTGWRFSECTPLTVGAIDDTGNGVWVSVLGVHRRDDGDRQVFVERDAKSTAGVRRINLPPVAAAMVRRRIVGKGPGELVFTNARGSVWRSNNFLRSEFARILAGVGIEKTDGMGPHYLRHTHVMMLDRAEVSLAKMQRRIGHEDIQTTLNVYGGMIDNTLSAAELAAVDALVAPQPAAAEVVAGQVVEMEPSQSAQVVLGELGELS